MFNMMVLGTLSQSNRVGGQVLYVSCSHIVRLTRFPSYSAQSCAGEGRFRSPEENLGYIDGSRGARRVPSASKYISTPNILAPSNVWVAFSATSFASRRSGRRRGTKSRWHMLSLCTVSTMGHDQTSPFAERTTTTATSLTKWTHFSACSGRPPNTLMAVPPSGGSITTRFSLPS